MSLKGKNAKYEQVVPKDLQGFRAEQLGLLRSLLGMDSMAGGGIGGGAARGTGGTGGGMFDRIKAATNPMPAGGGFGGGNGGAGLESFFGPMGMPATPLQRQATGGISQYLNQPAPEQRALETSMPMLQAILDGKPGQGIMDALQPQFQRNLASANQEGGRFGSANAIMRGRAVEDFNLLGAQAAQQGQQTQLQAADILRMLSGQAGQNPFSRLMGAAESGRADAAQGDVETQRRLQLLMSLLGTAQGTAFNLPIVQTRPGSEGFWDQLLKGGIQAGASFAGRKAGGG